MSVGWFYQKWGEAIGPVTLSELCRLANVGELSSSALVKHGLNDVWRPAFLISQLGLPPIQAATVDEDLNAREAPSSESPSVLHFAWRAIGHWSWSTGLFAVACYFAGCVTKGRHVRFELTCLSWFSGMLVGGLIGLMLAVLYGIYQAFKRASHPGGATVHVVSRAASSRDPEPKPDADAAGTQAASPTAAASEQVTVRRSQKGRPRLVIYGALLGAIIATVGAVQHRNSPNSPQSTPVIDSFQEVRLAGAFQPLSAPSSGLERQ